MRRKLTIAMLLSLSASSLQALALGVGEAAVNSPLNAPLRATIPLTDTSGLDPELLRVSVAEPREFESAGLIRSPLAASVRAAVQVREGQLVVDLITERAVREPWLDLMLSFEWPGGRQLREVTLLLDPPDYDQLPVLVGLSSAAPAATAARSAADPVRESPSRTAPAQSQDAQSGDPAWVNSGDTLWAVAGRLRPDSGISMDQMMVALVEANPDVFPSGNINAMRAGHALVVPSRDAIMARSSQQAGDVVQAMNQAWASRGSGAPARVPLGTSGLAIAEAAAGEPADAVSESEPEREVTSGDEAVATDVAAVAEEAPEPRLTLLSDADLAAEAVSAEQSDEGGAGGGETEASTPSEADPVSPGPQLDPEVLALLDAEALVPQSEAQRLASLERRWLESRSALEAVQAERDALQEELGGLR
ncbi:type IV pilus assembly protein FimV, partial [Halomonas sp. BC04]|uniref:type IV pilus assembly protein FimV n=1 Tax=Halomonas sp. BC04 TaxID=1403540 RepID=UPI0003ED85B6